MLYIMFPVDSRALMSAGFYPCPISFHLAHALHFRVCFLMATPLYCPLVFFTETLDDLYPVLSYIPSCISL